MLGFVTGASSGIGEAFARQLVTATLAGLGLGETICVPGLNDPSMIDTVSQAQQALLQAAVSSPLAYRYQEERER